MLPSFERQIQGGDGRPGLIGDIVHTDDNVVVHSMGNASGGSPEVITATLSGTFAAGTVFLLSLVGVAFSVTTEAGTTSLDEAADQFARSLNADPEFGAVAFTATATGPVLTITSKDGQSLEATGSANTAIATSQTAGQAQPLPFARVVLRAGFSQAASHRGANQLCQLALSTALAAQVETFNVGFAAGATYLLEVDGKKYAAVAADTDDATTATAIETAYNADPIPGITASTSAGQFILTGAAAVGFTASVDATGDGTVEPGSGKVAGDIDAEIVGIVKRTYNASNEPQYDACEPADVIRRGPIRVQVDATDEASIRAGGPVYVSLDAATAGRCYPTDGPNRVLCERLTWRRVDSGFGSGVVFVDAYTS